MSLTEDGWVKNIITSKDANWELSCGDGGIKQWNLTNGKQISKYEGDRILAMSLSQDETILVALGKSNHILVWNLNE